MKMNVDAPQMVENAGIRCQVRQMCPICGGIGPVIHRQLQDHLFGAKGRWGIRQCEQERCRLMWLDPMPYPAEVHKFYENYYTHDVGAASNQPVGQQIHPAPAQNRSSSTKLALAAIFAWRKSAFLTNLCHLEDMAPGRLLEIGCGSGHFLREASQAGWQATGIDFDEKAVAATRSIPGVKADLGDLHSMKFADSAFDAIVMNNVIEHVPNPVEVIDECRRVLSHSGRLVVITPNSRALGYRHFAEDWRGLEIPRHLHIFSPASLKVIAQNAKFRRVSTFSSAGGITGIGVIVESEKIASKRLRCSSKPRIRSPYRLIAREKLLVLLGRDVGEFAVLVAGK